MRLGGEHICCYRLLCSKVLVFAAMCLVGEGSLFGIARSMYCHMSDDACGQAGRDGRVVSEARASASAENVVDLAMQTTENAGKPYRERV